MRIIKMSLSYSVLFCLLVQAVLLASQKETATVLQDLKKANACVALFSPADDITNTLCSLIDQETKQIMILMYTFTSKPIAEALLRAHKRKIPVILVVDRSCVNDRYNKVEYLATQGISVFVYDPVIDHGKETSGLMHNKCALFLKNIAGKTVLVTGSFNFTQSAGTKNHENVLILNDAAIVSKYTAQFDLLKKRSMLLTEWRDKRPIIYNNIHH